MDDSPLDAREHFAEPADVEQAGRGVGARGPQQHVVRLVAAQHVIDQVGRDRDLRAAIFSLPGKRRSISPAMIAQVRKVRFINADFGKPGFEIVAEHVLVEQRGERELAALDLAREVAERPRPRAHIRWRRSRAAAAAPARAGASAACRASGARAAPRTDSRPDSACRRAEMSRPGGRAAPGSSERHSWISSHRAHLVRQRAPRSRSASIAAHAVGEIGRERKLAALIGRHLGILGRRARDVDLVLDQRLVFQDLAGEHEGVARRQRLDEIFLDLAEHPARRAGSSSRRASAPAAP